MLKINITKTDEGLTLQVEDISFTLTAPFSETDILRVTQLLRDQFLGEAVFQTVVRAMKVYNEKT